MRTTVRTALRKNRTPPIQQKTVRIFYAHLTLRNNNRMRILKINITLLLCIALLSGCARHVQDTHFIRPVAAQEINTATARLPAGYTLRTDQVATADGHTLYRARFSHPDAKSTVLFFGGNQSTLGAHAVSTVTKLAQDWHPNFVFADYRGYGQSSGTPTLDALASDALMLFDAEAKSAAANHHKLVIAGYSMGSAVAGQLLERRKPDGIILITTFSNVNDVLESTLPWYIKPFMKVTFDAKLATIDNERALKSYTGPLLIIGAENDNQTPAPLSVRVFSAAATPADQKQLVIAKGAERNNILNASETRDAIRKFSTQHHF